MAKFIYRMQNVLDIKYKLENQAKEEYSRINIRLSEEEGKLKDLREKKAFYVEEYRRKTQGLLDIIDIENCKNSIDVMDEFINKQIEIVNQVKIELEIARVKLTEVIKERKIHEKLKENQFEDFKQDLNKQEMKEIDELVSYQHNGSK